MSTQASQSINLKITLLKTGATFDALKPRAGCYETWFADLFGEGIEWSIIDAPSGDLLPPVEEVEVLVISGSPVSVYERLSWSVACSAWIKQVWERRVPILGVCYGHQLLADALGGEVTPSPKGREMGAIEVIQVGDDPLFAGLPERFDVWQTHIDEVSVAPSEATMIAHNDHCAVQAMAIGDHCRSVQWHPEMNHEIMDHYVRERVEMIDQAWGSGAAEALRARLPERVESGAIIAANFIRHFCLT